MNFVASMLLKNANIQQTLRKPPVDTRTDVEMRNKILKLLTGKRMTCAQVATAIKRDYKNARRFLFAMMDDGLLQTDGTMSSRGTKPATAWTRSKS